ncbi:MAG: hypothetical protein MR637_00150 [Clostridiales bacterium]|nr:hypothetical protein [Clostridiales bacterium]
MNMDRLKRMVCYCGKTILFSFVGMVVGCTISQVIPGMEEYEEYILAVCIALGAIWVYNRDGFKVFKYLVFYVYYLYFLTAYAIAFGVVNGLSERQIGVRILLGAVEMALLLIGFRLYIFKNLAIRIGRLEFGCFPKKRKHADDNRKRRR